MKLDDVKHTKRIICALAEDVRVSVSITGGVGMVERSKASDSSSGLRKGAWVQTPLLTSFADPALMVDSNFEV